MKIEDLAKRLLEFQETPDNTTSTEMDRLLLRVANYPALIANLVDIGQKEGKYEMVFMNLPDSIIEDIQKIIGPTDVEVLKFSDERGRPMVGFRFDLAPIAEITNAEPDDSGSKSTGSSS